MNVRPGIGNSAAFQVSGWPWITGTHITSSLSYVKITLPAVSKSITINNVDASAVRDPSGNILTGSDALLVFFGKDLTGSYPAPQVLNNHYIEIPISSSFTFDVKCSQFFVAKKNAAKFAAFQAFVELTNCGYEDLYAPNEAATTLTRDGVLTGSGIDF